MTSDRFFAGLIAAIRHLSEDPPDSTARLTVNRISLNRAFHRAVMSPAGEFIDRKKLAIDYDPLYGVSPWFERALTHAQRDLLISFPNPTYSTVEIKLNKQQADSLLAKSSHRDEFVELARAFKSNIVDSQDVGASD